MITSGSIKFTSPSNYNENRKGAEVTLNFEIPEGAPSGYDQQALDRVGAMAQAKAVELTTGLVTPRVLAAVSPTLPAAAAQPAMPMSTPAPTTSGPTAPAPVSPSDPMMTGALHAVQGQAADPMMPGPTSAPVVQFPATVASPSAANGAAPVTDNDLVTAITQKNAQLIATKGEAGPVMIRKLIGDFVGPPPATARQMAAEQRPTFLAHLAHLS